ncbi:MAG: hypothetical protein IJX04_11935 [Oscillospiraceae bacterium]|nr:hypothetical protein [Oscillospiraceae bacterium]
MKKPTVTIKHPEAFYMGGALVMFSLVAVIPNIAAPPEEPLYGWMLVAVLLVFGLIILGFGETTETIDEKGICIKGLLKKRRYAWADIAEVGVARVRGTRPVAAHHPEVYVTLRGGMPRRAAGEMWLTRNVHTGLVLPYTRGVWDCIRHYYGEPDFDEWGQPPTNT